jgi:serine/threonine protein kinase
MYPSLTQLLKSKDPLLIDLVTRVLQYSPQRRLTPAAALQHEYFDELREEGRHQELLFKLKAVPELFDFSQGSPA